MTCFGVIRIFIGIIIIITSIGGWIGSVIYCGMWWDYVRIDFPAYGGDYLVFSVLVFLNWFLPVVFTFLTIISLIFDSCKSGNIISSFLSGIGIIALVGGFVTNPFLIFKASPSQCTKMYNEPANITNPDIQTKWDNWKRNKIQGLSSDKQQEFLDNLNDMRCKDAHVLHWYFFGAQLISVGLTFFLIPLYLFK